MATLDEMKVRRVALEEDIRRLRDETSSGLVAGLIWRLRWTPETGQVTKRDSRP
jgi:hypothetical protein